MIMKMMLPNNFYVINYDINKGKFVKYDIIPYLLNRYEELKDKPKNFEEFKEHILKWSKYHWWARCEYEILLMDWPCKKNTEKWDIHKQVEMNIDAITHIFISVILNNELKWIF